MTHNIDAVVTSSAITTTYRRYLQSLLAVRDPDLDAALRGAIDGTVMLDKGPLLEATPPYAPGATLRDLINQGVVSPGFTALESPSLPLDRALYVHQELSVRKAALGRNLVVATGTGSGKTESFLLPILDSLVREHEAGTLGPGVRALLLYPMNALANDQMKRLRQLLAGFPDITFGRYTGDTREDPQQAREMFSQLDAGEPLLENELHSRQEMRSAPPHLLLTNYAMLEYLLLRPRDSELFDSSSGTTWRFIVVDEAHVYDGSQGAEIAMLLRRLRDRVASHRDLQCIATSATVGGEADPEAVTTFASNLFGQTFEWRREDEGRQDLVLARRVGAPPGPYWGPMTAADYLALHGSDEADREEAVRGRARAAGWVPSPGQDDSAASALAHEQSFGTLRARLADGPRPLAGAAREVFGPDPLAIEALSAMVDLGSALRGRDGTTPLSARYHLFLRATEGAFTCLSVQGPHVQLARHEECPECDAPVFEIGSCKRCGAVHVVGSVETQGAVTRLRPRKRGGRSTWLVLSSAEAVVDEDEAAVEDEGTEVAGDGACLCAACGAVGKPGAASCGGCGSVSLRHVRRLKQSGDHIAGCLVCGGRGSGTVRLFESGADASSAVITTALYQAVPPDPSSDGSVRPGEGRKLLAFSDSRQSAAYFAPYLDDSYARLQRRRLLVQGLLTAGAHGDAVAVDDVVFSTRPRAVDVQLFAGGMTAQQQRRRIAPWVMAEVVAVDDRQSLEGLGLVGISMYREPSWQVPPPLLQLGLEPDEAWSLLQELVRTLRQQGAVTMPEEVPSNDEIFSPRLGPIRVRGSGPEPVRKVLSWLPGKGKNRRIDYVSRVLSQLGADADPTKVLDGAWSYLTSSSTPIDWLRASVDPAAGTTYQVDHERLRLSWVTKEAHVFSCDTCRRVAPVSVRGVCPALGCAGRLTIFVPPPAQHDRDHYRALYQAMHPVPLSVQEHTAQWASTEAAAIQQAFVRGDINALSCSTTFELGVDVGELQAVMLRNMPPRTANYLQRAGRAGRRSGAAALVVTYAMRRSHDLSKFAEPEAMITGEVRAPYVPLTNERIDRRHANSVAMAAFFRWLFETTGRIDRTAGAFFLPEDGNEPSVGLVEGFLSPLPTDVQESLERVLPAEVFSVLGVEQGTWAHDLVDLLETVRTQLAGETAVLEQLQLDSAAAGKYSLAQRFQKVGATLRKRDLLGFLANHNVLPKYGFPVDSVELRTDFGYGKDSGSRLDLSRDLAQAIYEYAPDASIVAGGSLWTSRGLYRLPGRELVEYEYQVCGRCSGFRHAVTAVDPACPHCGEVATTAARTITIPEFGFIADREPGKPGPRPPQRSWSGAVHVLAPSPEARQSVLETKGGKVGVEVGPRGQMIAVADGPAGRGFLVCDWCGHGKAVAMEAGKTSKQHHHPMTGKPCTGPRRRLDLAHTYETDLLTIDLRVPGLVPTHASYSSVMYAVLEAACDTLEIARDDVGGSLAPRGVDDWSIALFDTVSGGAGHVLLIEQNLQRVLQAALQRVSSCECGSETSCYGCLRSYGNQRDHDDLSRGAAEEVLGLLLGRPSGP